MNQVLEGTQGFLFIFYDVLVHGKTLEEQDQNLDNTLQKLQEANLTLNKDKCEFAQTSVKFVGNIVDSDGVRADPEKVKAILQMKAPKDRTELRRFLGMVNQLSKFQPKTAELTKPLRDLLSSKNQWLWSNDQDEACRAIKESLISTPTLAHYDASRNTKLSSDASWPWRHT